MDGQSYGHTDGRTTYCYITAFCIASRGKNCRLQELKNYIWIFAVIKSLGHTYDDGADVDSV